jgi:trk system potassium uptake protein TrkH
MDIVRESLVIFMALVAFASVVFGALLVTEGGVGGASSDALFFETVSAITTTGLSMGDTTARLSFAGKIVIMVAMFIGRLGALTVVLMIGDRESASHIRFPQEELVIG